MSAAMKKPDDLFPPTAPTSARQLEAADSVSRLVAPKLAARPRSFRSSKGAIERAREQMHAMAESADWEQAGGAHLVALYEWLHEQVYGVATAELDARTWALAAQAAARMADQQFEGDYGRAVVFMRWVWKREIEREKWRRENGKSGSRIGWKLAFHGSLVTDYKVDRARRSCND